jgi:hypothetical protein
MLKIKRFTYVDKTATDDTHKIGLITTFNYSNRSEVTVVSVDGWNFREGFKKMTCCTKVFDGISERN